jgi:hypothetical protein
MSARVTDSLPAGRREAERRGVQLETCTGSASLPDGAHIRVSLVFSANAISVFTLTCAIFQRFSIELLLHF